MSITNDNIIYAVNNFLLITTLLMIMETLVSGT